MEWVKKVLHNKSDGTVGSNSNQVVTLNTCRRFPVKKYGVEKSFLGHGSSCKVYLYNVPKTEQVFAVKSFEKKDLRKEDDINTIVKEIQIHQKLNTNDSYTHVVHLIDAIQLKNKSKLFLVLEYIPIDLQTFYTANGILIPQVDRLCYFKQIVNGLHFMQSRNIGHRDLKLENCCIDYTGNLRLIDFGSSTDGNVGYGMAGSPPYCAPEIHSQLKYNSFKCDVWSLGVLLINLFYLSKQAWITARHDDEKFVNYKNNPSIDTAVRLIGNVSDKDPIKTDIDYLILILLQTSAEARTDVINFMEKPQFEKIVCCIGNPQPTHTHKMFNRLDPITV